MSDLTEPRALSTRDAAVPTPYDRARAEWDERIGSARVQARNWRLLALGLLTLSLALTVGLIYRASQASVVPYIVELDANGGVHRVMDARAFADYTPQQGAVSRQIADWITWVRSLSSDPVVVRARWLRAYQFLTTEGANRLNAYAKAEDPFTRAGKETVAVDVSAVVALSDHTFEAQWTETRHTRGRGAEVVEPYVGVFTVRIVPPQDEEQAFQNPLGIRIDEFNWSRRY